MRGGVVAGGAGLYYWSHLEHAPITNRRRFMQVSEDQEKMLAQISLQEVMKQYGPAILPPSHPASRYVNKVAQRVIAAIQPELTSADTMWKVYVIDAPIANAFVLPGGEIFVFTGMLPIAANEDGLAAVIGHEIAHKIARHVAEKVSFYQFTSIAMMLFQVLIAGDLQMPFGDAIKNLLVFLPFSRKCEIEADYIGMLLMARACFDPAETAQVWRRMADQEKGPRPPAFLSTHPGHFERINKINEWLPEARRQFSDAGCYEQNKSILDSFFRM